LKTKKIHEEKMPRKEELFLSKDQIQKLCELYHEEEHLWNIQSPIVAEKNATKNEHICSMCRKINKVGKQEVAI
jgi:hypothetical protein